MLSPVALMLIASVSLGALVDQCDIGSVVIQYNLEVSNAASEPVVISLVGDDVTQSFTLKAGDKRDITSYAGGTVTILAASYDAAVGAQLAGDREFLRAQLRKGNLSASDIKQINDRINGLTAQITAFVKPPSGSTSTRLGSCGVRLDAQKTQVVEAYRNNSGDWELGCS